MSNPIDALAREALASLTTVGFTEALVIPDSDTVLIASVPHTRRQWANVALKRFTCLPLADAGGRARYALFPAVPDDAAPYSRTVYFRATGPGLARQHVGQELCHTVRIIPGYSTEADIPTALATTLFADPARAADITVTRLA